MDVFLLDNIPFAIHAEQLYAFLKIEPGSKFADRLDRLVEAAGDIAKPKALYKLSSVEHGDDNSVFIDGLKLKSRVVKINLRNRGRVFPFVATCGIEIEKWSNALDGQTHRFWADAISMLALGSAINALKDNIQKRFKPGPTSTMNPGSLEDWPLSEQYHIFSLLGDTYKTTGVQLTDNLIMRPLKSVSGLEFASGEKFYNCQLCSKNKCPMRRAPYDEHLYTSKYQK